MQALEVEQERAPVHATDGVTLPVATREARIAKRAVDLVGSLVLLVFVLLVGPLIMLAIKLDSRGPTVFRQYRVGRGGRRIPMYKFRTMYTGRSSSRTSGRVLVRTHRGRLAQTARALPSHGSTAEFTSLTVSGFNRVRGD
jgi:lipopolysaccharide/colanic/teichoic acid biosynthesis glycosyltransferase